MRRLYVPILTSLVFATGGFAAETWTADALELNLKDNRKVVFHLADSPELTFEKDDLQIRSRKDSQSVSYPMSDISYISFFSISGITPVNQPDLMFEISPVEIRVSHLDKGSAVRIFNSAGQIMATETADYDGQATIDITGYPIGIYVITAEGTSYKLMKP